MAVFQWLCDQKPLQSLGIRQTNSLFSTKKRAQASRNGVFLTSIPKGFRERKNHHRSTETTRSLETNLRAGNGLVNNCLARLKFEVLYSVRADKCMFRPDRHLAEESCLMLGDGFT